MDIQAYIESGILEEYCLGILGKDEQAIVIEMAVAHPEIRNELNAVELSLEKLAAFSAIEPNPDLKLKIFDALGFDKISLTEKIPGVDKNSDFQTLWDSVCHLIPDEPSEDFFAEEIRSDDDFQQMLVVSKLNVPEEEHDDFLESLYILKGQCECIIGNDVFKLGAGDFIEIPLNLKHDIKVLSPYVVAILQYEFV